MNLTTFRNTIVGAATLGLLATAACAPITTYSGYQAIDAAPSDVKAGVDTKSIVRGRLGSPSATSTFDPNVWFYINQVKEVTAFRKAKVASRNVVAVTFDKDSEQVTRVDRFTLRDGKVIAFNGRETPTRGRELTIFEQLIGTVGRGTMLPQQDQGVPGNRPGDRR